jgi:hypothetical protein
MKLVLHSLNISLDTYGENKGEYKGTVNFVGQYSSIEIRLDPKLSKDVLEACKDSLLEYSKKMAENLNANILESTNLIEDKKILPI